MIPLTDLTLDQQTLKRIKKNLDRVILSKSYILGKELANFEQSFASFVGAKFAVGLANGTDALKLALRSLRIGRGDRVLTVAFTSPFTVLAIIEAGATPVFCDIDPDTMTIDLQDAARKISSKTKAIIPVHLYGNPCNMDGVSRLAREARLLVIEDACQAHGASYKKTQVGNFGKAGAFSFYPTKNLGAMGDAGILVTNDNAIFNFVKKLRHGGQSKRFWHEIAGVNSRLDEIQAAILSVKLRLLNAQNNKRRKLAKRYRQYLSGLPIKFQDSFPEGESVYHLFVIRTSRRDQLKSFLAKKKIFTDIYYPYPIYKQSAFEMFSNGTLPVTERMSLEILALPIYPNLSIEQQDKVIGAIGSFYGKKMA